MYLNITTSIEISKFLGYLTAQYFELFNNKTPKVMLEIVNWNRTVSAEERGGSERG